MKKGIEDLLERHRKKFKDQQIYCNDIELIIEEIVKETNLSKGEIRKIVDSEFKMLREVMANDGLITEESQFENFKSIRLIRLGSFRPSDKKFKFIQEALKKKKNG